ncbi:hypothetical protein FOA52_012465 [Chlamydomonas sp. UWO 241]|nr:hypothetical protein FOA52_012465 [Chlamydomonas sp. UWO 241]
MASSDGGAPQEVGCRVQVQKDRATVRYLGSVAGQQGVWVGLEWDESSRGKHDGSTGGVRYFECASGHPTAGSFVRVEKVNFGFGVLEALRARYTNARGEMGDVDKSELWVHTVRNRKVFVELVGEAKISALQSQIQHLPSARVVGACISHLGDAAELAAALPSLVELDLTCNLVSGWGVAEGLCCTMTHLQVLNLSDNQLSLPRQPAGLATLPNLRALVLNDCGVDWQQVLVLQPLLPSLQELHLSGNGICSLAPIGMGDEREAERVAPVTGFEKLQVLALEDNCILDWREIERLAHLPNLAKLHLCNNAITKLWYPSTSVALRLQRPLKQRSSGAGAEGTEPPSATAAVPFPALSSLLLAGCQLANWDQMHELDKFPSLRELRVTGNPVLGLSKSGGRFEVIGRVHGLTFLNGADVRARERKDSETRYLQNILAEVEDAGPDEAAQAAARASHPRLPGLLEVHGAVLPTGGRGGGAHGALGSAMLELKLTCVAAAKNASMGSTTKKLPRSITIGQMKMLCEKLFKVKAGAMLVFMRSPDDPHPEDVTSEDDKSLGSLGLQDGYELLIDEFDPEVKRREEGRQKEVDARLQTEREEAQARAAELVAAEVAKSMAF